MLLAAVGYSFIPLAIMLSGSSETPFLFGAGWRGGIAIAYTVFSGSALSPSCSSTWVCGNL